MTRRVLRWACYGVLVSGVAAGLLLPLATFEHSGATALRSEGKTSEALPSQPFEISFENVVPLITGRPKPDVDDQLRDWAVYGTLVGLGLDVGTFTKASFRSTPVRLPYLEDAFYFEYGRGRRALAGNDRVLLFVEKDDPDQQATLGRLADRVRRETGGIPEKAEVFETTPDLPNGRILVSRKKVLTGTTLLGPDYGYVERSAKTVPELEAFLKDIDDITYAQLKGDGSVILGGRRFPRSRTPGVELADVAALYRAYEWIKTRTDQVKKELEEINRQYIEAQIAAKDRWRGTTKDFLRQGAAERERKFSNDMRKLAGLPPLPDDDSALGPEALKAKYQARADALQRPPAEPGFSLDPQWRIEPLVAALDRIKSEPCRGLKEIAGEPFRVFDTNATPLRVWRAKEVYESFLVGSFVAKSPEALCKSLSAKYSEDLGKLVTELHAAASPRQQSEALVPFYRLLDKLRHADDLESSVLSSLLEYLDAKYKLQCARYDGPLSGTRVGMNLFYTDLLAKLWALDFERSAPTAGVPGFVSVARLNLPVTFREESEKLPNTRLWFGPRKESLARSEDGNTVWLERVATRVYAAGSNPLAPGEESQPAEQSRRMLNWWDHHYTDVADYEPQYHVQNQIMKWSMLGRWLYEKKIFSDLAGVEAPSTESFDRWAAAMKDQLRYNAEIQLKPRADWIGGTECLDIFASRGFETEGSTHQVSGGVSLGGRESLESAPKIITSKSPLDRFTSSLEVAEGEAGPGTAMRARPKLSPKGDEVVVDLKKITRTREGASELRLGGLRLTNSKRSEGVLIRLADEKGELGSLTVRRGETAARLAWTDSDVELARREAERTTERLLDPSRGNAPPITRLAPSRGLDGRAPVLLADDNVLLLPQASSDRVIRVATGPAKQTETTDIVRTALKGSKDVAEARASLLQGGEVEKLVGRYEWQRLSPRRADASAAAFPDEVTRTFGRQGPPGGAREVTLEGIDGFPAPLKAYVGDDGSLFVQRPTDLTARAAWQDFDRKAALNGDDLNRIARKAGSVVRRGDLSNPHATKAVLGIERGNFAMAIHELRASAGDDVQRLAVATDDLRLKTLQRAQSRLGEGDFGHAERLYDFVRVSLGGRGRENLLREGLANIASGRPAKGTSLLEAARGAGASPEEVDNALKAVLLDQDTADTVKEVFHGGDARLGFGSDGTRLVGAYRLPQTEAHALDFAERARIVERNGAEHTIYIEDTFSLNKFDLEAPQGEILRVAIRMPRVGWVDIQAQPFEKYRPGQLIAEKSGIRYRRAGLSSRLPASGTGRVLLLRNCDQDGDGSVSPLEQAACASF